MVVFINLSGMKTMIWGVKDWGRDRIQLMESLHSRHFPGFWEWGVPLDIVLNETVATVEVSDLQSDCVLVVSHSCTMVDRKFEALQDRSSSHVFDQT